MNTEHHEQQPMILNQEQFKSKYLATRSNNLRCFPQCDPQRHSPKSFCGCPVKGHFQLASSQDMNTLTVYGVFRTVQDRAGNESSTIPLPLDLGELERNPTLSKGMLVFGEDEKNKEDLVSFIIPPVRRRWTCREFIPSKNLVFTTFLVLNGNTIIASVDSPKFEVYHSLRKSNASPKSSISRTLAQDTKTTTASSVHDEELEDEASSISTTSLGSSSNNTCHSPMEGSLKRFKLYQEEEMKQASSSSSSRTIPAQNASSQTYGSPLASQLVSTATPLTTISSSPPFLPTNSHTTSSPSSYLQQQQHQPSGLSLNDITRYISSQNQLNQLFDKSNNSILVNQAMIPQQDQMKQIQLLQQQLQLQQLRNSLLLSYQQQPPHANNPLYKSFAQTL